MKVGDLIRNMRHPHAGIGMIVEVGAPRPEPDYVIAVWPDGNTWVAYNDEIEIISNIELEIEELAMTFADGI